MMLDYDDGEALLAALLPIDRAGLDDMVEAFIRDELQSESAAALAYAAAAFEARAAKLPEAPALIVRRFAAALLQRAKRLRYH
jgi:hypothetical protein